MLLGEIIKEYRAKHNLSLQDFADKIGTSRSYIHMLEKNINPSTNKPINPSIETLKSLANAMDLDVDTLLKKLDDNQLIFLNEEKYKEQFNTSTSTAVVLVYGTIPAGIPMECIEDILDTEEIPASMLKGGKQYFGLKVKGNSMFPAYLNGDTVIFEKVDDCESGQDCVVMVNGNDGTFKRVLKNKNGIILQPLNSEYEPLVFTNEQINNLPVKIIGIAKEIRRKI